MHDQYNKARNSTKDQGNSLWHLQTTRESPWELVQVVKQIGWCNEVHILFNLTHANKHDIKDSRFELEKSHLSI